MLVGGTGVGCETVDRRSSNVFKLGAVEGRTDVRFQLGIARQDQRDLGRPLVSAEKSSSEGEGCAHTSQPVYATCVDVRYVIRVTLAIRPESSLARSLRDLRPAYIPAVYPTPVELLGTIDPYGDGYRPRFTRTAACSLSV